MHAIYKRFTLSLLGMLFLTNNLTAQSNIKQPVLGRRSAKLLTIARLSFKDLNRNGSLDKYEDRRLPLDVRTSDLLDIVIGKFKPSGKMPFTTPVSEEAVRNQKEDTPGYLEGAGYPLFKYGEGIRY